LLYVVFFSTLTLEITTQATGRKGEQREASFLFFLFLQLHEFFLAQSGSLCYRLHI
jgi:hypothetical protein